MALKRLLQGIGAIALIFLLIGVYTFLDQSPILQARNAWRSEIAGYIDVQLIFEQHPQKFRAEDILQEEARKLQARFEEEAEGLTESEQRNLLERYRREFLVKEQELVRGVVQEIEKMVGRIAAEESIEIVLEKQNVIYGGKDLTPLVLERVREADNLD